MEGTGQQGVREGGDAGYGTQRGQAGRVRGSRKLEREGTRGTWHPGDRCMVRWVRYIPNIMYNIIQRNYIYLRLFMKTHDFILCTVTMYYIQSILFRKYNIYIHNFNGRVSVLCAE